MVFKLNKYETMGLEWYIFLKRPLSEMKQYINRCKVRRMQGA